MDELGDRLLRLARNAIAEHFGQAPGSTPLAPNDLPALHEPGASFVTLTQHDALRGCIGSLEACRPLLDDVRANACAAAFRDPRFPPLSADELPITRIEVSLLGPARPLVFSSEADALRQLQPGCDGLILEAGRRRATFLPQVWTQLPEPVDFLAQLKRKAGLSADYWGPDIRLARYAVRHWQEEKMPENRG